jgi:hypothetical protein
MLLTPRCASELPPSRALLQPLLPSPSSSTLARCPLLSARRGRIHHGREQQLRCRRLPTVVLALCPNRAPPSPARVAPEAPLSRPPRSPERPATGDATGLAAGARGRATSGHLGPSHGHRWVRPVMEMLPRHSNAAGVASLRRTASSDEPPLSSSREGPHVTIRLNPRVFLQN